MLKSKIFRGKHTSFVALTSTFNIMLIHTFQEQNMLQKNLQREITLLPLGARQNSMDFFNVGFILIRY